MPPALIPEQLVQEAIEKEFSCERCGNCCKGDGAVVIGPAEADRIAKFLKLTRREFVRRFAFKIGQDEWQLVDKANREQWCIFLERGEDGLYGCAINAVKPDQCGSFPAKWKNEDSFRTCAGLRILMRKLKERAEAAG